MIHVIIGAIVILVTIVSFATWIAGAVIARRASRRWQWPEARLAFLAFVSVTVMVVVSAFTLPLIGWLTRDSIAIDLIQWISALFGAANAVAIVTIAIAMYRLAKRAARDKASQP